MVLQHHFASPAAALDSSDLQNTSPVTYKTLALLMLTWASSSRPARVTSALLQTGFSDSVACCFYGKSGQQLSPMPLPAESKPKPSRSGFLLHLYH